MRDWGPRGARYRWTRERVGFAVAVAILASVLLVVLVLLPNGDDERTRSPTGTGPFDYDANKPLFAAETGEPEITVPGYSLTGASYTSFDGRRVPAIFATPDDREPPYRCVVSQPGLGENLGGFSIPRALADSDYAVFTVQPRLSATRAAAAAAAQSPDSLRSMLQGTVIDLRRGLDYLEQSDKCLPEIGYFGGSFGGMLGTMVAASDDRIAAAALIGAGGDWRHLVEGRPQFFLSRADRGRRLQRAVRLLRVVDPARWIGRISPRPVLLVNGRLDTFIPPAAARALRSAARDPKEVLRPRTQHDPFNGPLAGRLNQRVADFFRGSL